MSGLIPRFSVYIFDLDGTLVDSAEDICGAIRGVLRKTHAHSLTNDFLRSYIGRHLLDLFHDVLPDMNATEMDALVQEYRTVYAAREHLATKLYPAVKETLAALGGRKATATTKGTPTTRIVLGKISTFALFRSCTGNRRISRQTGPRCPLQSYGGPECETRRMSVCRRFHRRYAGRASRRHQSLWRDLWLWPSRGNGKVVACVLD